MEVSLNKDLNKKTIKYSAEFTFAEIQEAYENADKYGKVLIKGSFNEKYPELLLLQASSIAKALREKK